MDHYQRWLTVDSTFQVKAWGCNPGSYNHLEFLQMKLQNALGEQREYCNSVTAHDMWIIAGVAELLGANFKNPSLVRLTSFNKQIFLEHIKVGSELISNRLITNESNLTNFEGENVLGLIFEPHALPNKDSYLYAGNTNPDCPPSESLVTSISWDISHARRWVHVFESLYSNRNVSAQSFPSKFVMQKISNQFLYGVFNKDFTMPLFSNYFDGKNGWYRFGYKNRVGWGYAPYDLSISAITGGYCFWSKYNSDFDLLRNSLWQMINTKDQAIINHVTDHFGTRYSSCVKKENRDFDHLNAKEKSIDLLQF
jgi:hypothetical protein